MKPTLRLTCLTLFIVCVSSVQAALITHSYNATITRVWEVDSATSTSTDVSPSTFMGVTISVGDNVRGSFTYDSSLPISGYAGSPSSTYYTGNLSGGFVVTPSGFSRSFSRIENTYVNYNESGYAYDGFHIFPGGLDYYIYLIDHSGTTWSSDALPTNLNLSSFNQHYVTFRYVRPSDGDTFNFNANITELSAVPEPSTCLSMIVAIGLIVFIKRKQIQKKILDLKCS